MLLYSECIQKRYTGGEIMNTAKLLGIIKENNDTQDVLANAIGLSRARLSAKIHERDGAMFNQAEMLAIKKRYNLDDTTFNAIFFADNVS